MARLPTQDYVQALAAANALAGVTTRDEFGPVVLDELTRLIRSDVTTLNEIDPVSARLVYLATPESFPFPTGAERVFAELAHTHPLIRHHTETRDGSAIKISDFLTKDQWHAREIYRHFYSRVGLEHQLSITLPAPTPIVVGVALNRAESDFAERDRAVLNLLRPHVSQAWRRARDHDRLRALLTAAAGAMEQAGTAAIALSDPPEDITAGALVSLYRFFGRPAPRDPLPARVRTWLTTQRRQQNSTPRSPALARPLRATLDGRQLVLRYLPPTRDRYATILLDERTAAGQTDTLRQIGLTQRETLVLRLAGEGASNADISKTLAISPWTVKRHLANIYSKLGVGNRIRAAAVATEIDAHHHTPRPPADQPNP